MCTSPKGTHPFAGLPRLKLMVNPLDGRMVHTPEVTAWLAEHAEDYYAGRLYSADVPSALLSVDPAWLTIMLDRMQAQGIPFRVFGDGEIAYGFAVGDKGDYCETLLQALASIVEIAIRDWPDLMLDDSGVARCAERAAWIVVGTRQDDVRFCCTQHLAATVNAETMLVTPLPDEPYEPCGCIF